tara:strand:+ start:935 stop:1885 length:951 start_codon:yes stop_codon:yes gene_type:complete
MGVAKALGKAAIDLGQQTLKKFAKKGYTKNLAPQVIKSLTDHINITKAADVPEMETMFKGMKAGDDAAYESFNDFTKTLSAADQYQSNVSEMTRTVRGYTRPDAVQNLQAAGADRLSNMKRTPRTIQGPVPPQLADKSFDQGARSYEEAVMAGTTKFVDEAGIPTQIRNYGSDTAPHGRTTKVEVRKTSGRGKTAEGDTRKINEMLATDPTLTPAEKQAFGRIMAQAAAEGMDGDHIVEIARVANAVRDMTPAQRKAYFKRFKSAGVALGNDPKNVQKLSKQDNQVVKPAELRAIDNSIKNMDKRGKSLLQEMMGI